MAIRVERRKIIEALQEHDEVEIRACGNSMTPIIYTGDLITLSSDISNIEVGDAVFCKVRGNKFCHKVTAIRGNQYQISNNHGHVNGWITKNAIYGKMVKVERGKKG